MLCRARGLTGSAVTICLPSCSPSGEPRACRDSSRTFGRSTRLSRWPAGVSMGAGAFSACGGWAGSKNMERYFWGWRERDGTPQVRWADGGRGHLLSARRDLFNHSPCGFEWGYGGSGPAQLALAILCKVMHDDERAVQLYQQRSEEHTSELQ